MIKRLLAKFSRTRRVHQASVHIAFSQEDEVAPSIQWHHNQNREEGMVTMSLHLYARILYELAELHEPRVARELIGFLSQVVEKILLSEDGPVHSRLPLGQLRLLAPPLPVVHKEYRAEFYQLQDGAYQLEFQASVGKEKFYLPAAFLIFLQTCLDELPDSSLKRLARAINRLHDYFRYRRDFWDGTALSAGPAFALGTEELRADEKAEQT